MNIFMSVPKTFSYLFVRECSCTQIKMNLLKAPKISKYSPKVKYGFHLS